MVGISGELLGTGMVAEVTEEGVGTSKWGWGGVTVAASECR